MQLDAEQQFLEVIINCIETLKVAGSSKNGCDQWQADICNENCKIKVYLMV